MESIENTKEVDIGTLIFDMYARLLLCFIFLSVFALGAIRA